MSRITTHVLDTARGRPAAGVRVSLALRAGERWTELATAATDADGRIAAFNPDHPPAVHGEGWNQIEDGKGDVGHQEPLWFLTGDDRQAGGIGHGFFGRQLDIGCPQGALALGDRLQRNGEEALRRQRFPLQLVDGDPVAQISFSFSGQIAERSHGGS